MFGSERSPSWSSTAMMVANAKRDLNSIDVVSLLNMNRTWVILSHLRSMNVVVCGSTGDRGVPSQISH